MTVDLYHKNCTNFSEKFFYHLSFRRYTKSNIYSLVKHLYEQCKIRTVALNFHRQFSCGSNNANNIKIALVVKYILFSHIERRPLRSHRTSNFYAAYYYRKIY